MYHVYVKTITLSEDAYQRLAVWKEEKGDSFSKVVLRYVPKKGTIEDLKQVASEWPALTEAQSRVMEEALKEANQPPVE
jgi:predicted CopG family antitoxin